MKKTNAVRELDQHKIPYGLKEYEVNENDLSAVHVALTTNTDLERIFKTLSLLNEKNELIIACIPGGDNINLKKLAKTAKTKKLKCFLLKTLQNIQVMSEEDVLLWESEKNMKLLSMNLLLNLIPYF